MVLSLPLESIPIESKVGSEGKRVVFDLTGMFTASVFQSSG